MRIFYTFKKYYIYISTITTIINKYNLNKLNLSLTNVTIYKIFFSVETIIKLFGFYFHLVNYFNI